LKQFVYYLTFVLSFEQKTTTHATPSTSPKLMLLHRISHEKYIQDLSGKGAWLNGGRWNSPGKAVLYTSESLALAAWEVFVHTPKDLLPPNLMHAIILLPDSGLHKPITIKDLPENWDSSLAPEVFRQTGDKWLDSLETLLLKVPSAVIATAFNYLINPKHPDFHLVKIQSIQPFRFDERLFKKNQV
jgi:RES domain-containing protein